MTTTLQGDGPLIVVDDSPHDIEILERCFARSDLAAHYRLQAVGTGQGLLDHMTQVEAGAEPMPSIVLLDINMPGMDGFEALRVLRSREPFKDLPTVVFVTNSDDPRDAERAQNLGAAFAEKFGDLQEGIRFFNDLIDR